MGFLADEETKVLRITKMILHVVSNGDCELASEMKEVQQEQFFLERIQDVNASGLFKFKPESRTKALLAEIASGAKSFEAASQELSRNFAKDHVGASRDGAFFIFELESGHPDTQIFGLVKYDYKPVVEKTDKDGQVHLRRIVEAFIEDKKALQKSCIVRVTDGIVQDEISAKDRMGKTPNLTDYFTKFLDVERDRTDDELNKSLMDGLRAVLNSARSVLPEQNVGAAFGVVKDHLRAKEYVDEDSITEAVLSAAGNPHDDGVRNSLRQAVKRQLKVQKLTGLSFKPSAQIMRRSQRRHLRTAEGIVIEYPIELENASVKRDSRPDGSVTFVIETRRIEDDKLIRDKAGSKN